MEPGTARRSITAPTAAQSLRVRQSSCHPSSICLHQSASPPSPVCLSLCVCCIRLLSHTHTHTAPHPIITTPKKLQCSCIQQDTAVHFYPTCISPLHPSTRTSIHPFGSPSYPASTLPSTSLCGKKHQLPLIHPHRMRETSIHPCTVSSTHPSVLPGGAFSLTSSMSEARCSPSLRPLLPSLLPSFFP